MGDVRGIEVMVCRTGYTGEAGVELLCAAEDATEVLDRCLMALLSQSFHLVGHFGYMNEDRRVQCFRLFCHQAKVT